MVAGKVMMDRNAPAALLDTAETGFEQSQALIAKWHGRGRLEYAITPRFAPTSTEAQLEAASALANAHPDMHIQTHLSENHAEIAFVAELFPWSKDYTDVYDRFGLVRKTALFGHCIHLSERERQVLGGKGASAIFCPTSNLFLGSGLFDRAAIRSAGIRVGIATDIGGGTSYSMLRTLAEGYKVLAMTGQKLPAFDAFHMATRGNALAMGLGDRIGRIAPGFEADWRGARHESDQRAVPPHGTRRDAGRRALHADDAGRRTLDGCDLRLRASGLWEGSGAAPVACRAARSGTLRDWSRRWRSAVERGFRLNRGNRPRPRPDACDF